MLADSVDIPVDNFGTVVPYGILALWAVNGLSIVYWDDEFNFGCFLIDSLIGC